MVKRMKPIKVTLGLNFVTVFVTTLLACLEGFILVLCSVGNITKGDGEWLFALRFLYGVVTIWVVCFFIALAVCRKKLIVTDSKLMVTKGREILYETSIAGITWIEYDFFAPVTRSQIGEMLLAARNPKPESLHLYMGWISYKRIEKRIKRFLSQKT